MRVFYVVQALDDGSFLGMKNGEYHYETDFAKAYQFGSLSAALEHARDIDDCLDGSRVAVHPVYQP